MFKYFSVFLNDPSSSVHSDEPAVEQSMSSPSSFKEIGKYK